MAKLNARKELTYCRAGHTPLLLYRSENQQCEELIPKGIGIGLPDGGKFSELLESIKISIKSGDVLIFYTDGVTETMNAKKAFFDEERLEKVVIKNAEKSAAEIKNAILAQLARFRGATLPHDDVTIVIMKAL